MQPRISLGGAEFECRVPPALLPSALRAFGGTTPHDAEIDSLPIPMQPLWLRAAVRLLRFYRRRISIGARCVFEPSCSRYAELALRRRGAVRGFLLTVRRLLRCRSGNGGVDLP